MPTLQELCALYDILPELGPPAPRRPPPTPPAAPPPKPKTPLQRLYTWLGPPTPVPAVTRPNPFPMLKQGKKSIVIAVVDAGTVGFFRLGMGVFEEWPML